MKVGNTVDGLTVVDVKRINKMNLIQFTKAVSEYIEQGYKLDVHSSRQIGLVLQCDMYKLEEPQPYADTNGVPPISAENVIKITEDQAQWLSEKLEETPVVNEALQEALDAHKILVDDSVEKVTNSSEVSEVEQNAPPVKKVTRTKKQTT